MTDITQDGCEYTESREAEGTVHMLRSLADAIENDECRFISVEIQTNEFLEDNKAKREYHLKQFDNDK